MVSPETQKPAPVFYETSISEIDLSLLKKPQVIDYFHSVARELNYDPDTLLYRGTDGREFQKANSFGDRRETWACTNQELLTSTKRAELTGDWASDSPLYYALDQSHENPAIILFDGAKLDTLNSLVTDYEEGQPIRTNQEYRVKDGLTMDQAVVAVVYITH